MNYVPTKEEKTAWLESKINTDTFGVGDIKLNIANDGKINHIYNDKNTKILCGLKQRKNLIKFQTTYITLLLNHIKTTCVACYEELADELDVNGTFAYNYDYDLYNIAEEILTAEKLLKNEPEKHTEEWLKLAVIHTALKSGTYPFEQATTKDTLPNTTQQTADKIAAYLEKNPCQINDPILQEKLRRGAIIGTNKGDLHLVKTLRLLEELNISRTKALSLVNKKRVKKLIAERRETHHRTKKYRWWTETETIQEEYQNVLISYEKYLQKLNTLHKPLNMEKNSLLKINNTANTMELYSLYLYMLEAKVQTTTSKGVLIPTELLLLLQPQLEAGFENLGMVKNTDTLEILETALGLNLETDEALKTARLLLKES